MHIYSLHPPDCLWIAVHFEENFVLFLLTVGVFNGHPNDAERNARRKEVLERLFRLDR